MFESELDSHEAFVFAANRALAEIYSERKRLETIKIYKKRISPKELYERLSHKGGEDLAISLEALSISRSISRGVIIICSTSCPRAFLIAFSSISFFSP